MRSPAAERRRADPVGTAAVVERLPDLCSMHALARFPELARSHSLPPASRPTHLRPAAARHRPELAAGQHQDPGMRTAPARQQPATRRRRRVVISDERCRPRQDAVRRRRRQPSQREGSPAAPSPGSPGDPRVLRRSPDQANSASRADPGRAPQGSLSRRSSRAQENTGTQLGRNRKVAGSEWPRCRFPERKLLPVQTPSVRTDVRTGLSLSAASCCSSVQPRFVVVAGHFRL